MSVNVIALTSYPYRFFFRLASTTYVVAGCTPALWGMLGARDVLVFGVLMSGPSGELLLTGRQN